MFSPNVQKDVRQPVAMQKFESIRDICIALNQESHKQDFFTNSQSNIEKNANQFVEAFAFENGMQTRTVQPFNWSFSIGDEKLFDDGLIELMVSSSNQPYFGYVDVTTSKITQEDQEAESLKPETNVQVDNIHAHEAWLMRLNQQLMDWKAELKQLSEHESIDLNMKLKSLETMLDNIKADSKRVSNDVIREIDQRWNAIQVALYKIKNSLNK